MINAGDTVYYHGTHTDLHGQRFRVAAAYPVGFQPRYDLALLDDPTRTPVLTGACTASLTIVQATSVEAYNRRAADLTGLR